MRAPQSKSGKAKSRSNPPISASAIVAGPPQLLVDSKEAARRLLISERTLYELAKRQIIPRVKLMGNVRYHLPSVEKALLALQASRLKTLSSESLPGEFVKEGE